MGAPMFIPVARIVPDGYGMSMAELHPISTQPELTLCYNADTYIAKLSLTVYLQPYGNLSDTT